MCADSSSGRLPSWSPYSSRTTCPSILSSRFLPRWSPLRQCTTLEYGSRQDSNQRNTPGCLFQLQKKTRCRSLLNCYPHIQDISRKLVCLADARLWRRAQQSSAMISAVGILGLSKNTNFSEPLFLWPESLALINRHIIPITWKFLCPYSFHLCGHLVPQNKSFPSTTHIHYVWKANQAIALNRITPTPAVLTKRCRKQQLLNERRLLIFISLRRHKMGISLTNYYYYFLNQGGLFHTSHGA